MRRTAGSLTLLLLAIAAPAGFAADPPARRPPREALRPFNALIGTWKGIGTPEGRAEERRKGTWEETVSWEWQFKDGDAWLKASFDKGKHFTDGTLRYLPDRDQFQLSLTTTGGQAVAFTGALKDHRLIAERRDEKTRETQRIVVTLLYDNRYLYHYEVQPENYPLARKVYLVGASKEGQPFVQVSDEIGPLCVVSYGPPLTPIAYNGKTYYVCCSSCRSEFRAQPEKYIKEYEEYIAKLIKERDEAKRKR